MKTHIALIVVLCLASASAAAQEGFWIDLEGGWVTAGLNDVQIPGDTGTRISLTDDLEGDAAGYYRIRAAYRFGQKHVLSGLFAPLTLEVSGLVPTDVTFVDETFAAGSELDGTYTFNSYRLTYRYEFTQRGRWSYGLGFTAKIRDAVVRIEGDGKVAEKTNVGFVPLLNFRLGYELTDRLSLSLTGDALAAPQGRAEDLQLALGYRATPSTMLRAGYRIIEGGADNDEVYSFALLHYAAVGLTISF